jgi:hypothetical protein
MSSSAWEAAFLGAVLGRLLAHFGQPSVTVSIPIHSLFRRVPQVAQVGVLNINVPHRAQNADAEFLAPFEVVTTMSVRCSGSGARHLPHCLTYGVPQRSQCGSRVFSTTRGPRKYPRPLHTAPSHRVFGQSARTGSRKRSLASDRANRPFRNSSAEAKRCLRSCVVALSITRPKLFGDAQCRKRLWADSRMTSD